MGKDVISKVQQVVGLCVCLLLLSSLAIVNTGQWMGYDFRTEQAESGVGANDTLRVLPDGAVVINTSALASDVLGYGGKVPLEIMVKEGVVSDVQALDNAETKNFFDKAFVLLEKWKGIPVNEAAGLKVDAVSGATFSSRAIVANMERGLRYYQDASSSALRQERSWRMFNVSAKNVAGLVVVLMAAVLPLFVKNKKYLLFQLALNVLVLGFWCGSFLSYASLLGFVSQGVNVWVVPVSVVMLVVAFVYPLFGKKSHYCTFVCPFGSLQQVAGRCVKHKLRIGQAALKRLDYLRQVLWALLMLCIWSGAWSEWTDYEPFSAFIFQSASWIVLAVATLFVGLSFVVNRPYCRFVCPMGTLLRFSQNLK